MKTGLVLEGGAMRGMFTAGVMDVWLENGLPFDGAMGVSAGAVFGCNYKSRQAGRVIRYNVKYCREPRYCSVRSLLKTGDLYGADFCYRLLPEVLDPFDNAAYDANPMAFYAVCTDVETGQAVYHLCEKAGETSLDWFRASASMPLASRMVEIDGRKYLDGGIADSIPLKALEALGYARNVVILTQPEGFQKKPNKALPLIRRVYRKYPRLIETLSRRHEVYNETLTYVRRQEKAGAALVIRPEEKLPIGHVSHKAEELQAVYHMGRRMGEKRLDEVRGFLKS